MFCKYCGKEISDDARFCKFCGKSIAGKPVASSDIIGANNKACIDIPEKKNSRGRKFLAAAGIVIVMAIAIVIVYGYGTGRIHKKYECSDEMIDSTFEDCKVQIDNTVIVADGSMTADEAYKLIKRNKGYSIKCAVDTSGYYLPEEKDAVPYSPNGIIHSDGYARLFVYKNDELYYIVELDGFSVLNGMESIGEARVHGVTNLSKEARKNAWYAYGLPADGSGETYPHIVSYLLDSYISSSYWHYQEPGTYYSSNWSDYKLWVLTDYERDARRNGSIKKLRCEMEYTFKFNKSDSCCTMIEMNPVQYYYDKK